MTTLLPSDTTLIGECLSLVVDGTEFRGEFHSVMGMQVEEAREIARAWPNVGQLDGDTVALFVINALVNLWSYPIGDAMKARLPASRAELKALLDRWRSAH